MGSQGVEIAYEILRGLRASSIARIYDRLWPLFHKDPLEVFPAELMSLVLSYLEPSDLLTVSLVSGAWRERVTDSNLWKNKFSVEGWGLDGVEIAKLENTFRSALSPDKNRRSWQLSPLKNSIEKQRVSQDSLRWSSSLATGQIPSDSNLEDLQADHEMLDVDEIRTESSKPETHPNLPNDYSDATQMVPSNGLDPRVSPLRHRKPLILTSPPGYARINYHYIFKQKRRLEDNWDKGCYKNFQLPHRNVPHEAHEECVYTIQYQGNYLISGSRDKTLRIWNLTTGRLLRKPLKGHSGSVLCLQFDCQPKEDIIVSGSSDTNVILWRFSTGEMIKKISEAHSESVLNLRFDHRFLVTCSKDKTIKIWNRHILHPGDPEYPAKGLSGGGECPNYIIDDPSVSGLSRYQPSNEYHLMELEPYTHLMTLSLHGAAVNAIQIYKDQLVSASGDRNLRIWNIHTGQCYSKISAHEKGIACVQYDGKRIVSGSSDNSIRIWDPATRTEVARLEGHTRLVRTLQAAFADVPGGREKLEAEAAEIDRQWEIARDNGENVQPGRAGTSARPGSRRPRDLRSVGAKIPPSGGGSRWARIVSGSYDEKVIIWKKNADDEWVISHQLAQEEALTAAGPPLSTRTQVNASSHLEVATAGTGLQPARPSSIQPPQPRIASAPSTYPIHPPLALGNQPFNLLTPLSPAPAEQPPGFQPSEGSQPTSNGVNDRHSLSAAQKSPRYSRALPFPSENTTTQESSHQPPPPPPLPPPPAPAPAILPRARPPQMASVVVNPIPPHGRANLPPPTLPTHHGALPAGQPNARVFKLQFDARRIICCSQDNKIVGWDFANGDEDIIACSKFFADPQ